MLDYEKFLAFSEECNAHYRTLLRFEMKKMELIHEDNIENLSNALPEEQALIMKSNALENKRAEILGRAYSSKTFKDIIDEAPLNYKKRLNDQYSELCRLVGRIKEINDAAAVIINSRLKRMGGKHELDTYDGKGGVSKTSGIETHTTFNA